jgi:hypothetical protein
VDYYATVEFVARANGRVLSLSSVYIDGDPCHAIPPQLQQHTPSRYILYLRIAPARRVRIPDLPP